MRTNITLFLVLISFLSFANSNAPSSAFMEKSARSFMAIQQALSGLSDIDIKNLVITDQYTDESTGVTHIWFSQSVNGIRLKESSLGIHLDREGKVVFSTGEAYPNLHLRVSASKPGIELQTAITRTMSTLGIPYSGKLKQRENIAANRTTFEPIEGLNQLPTFAELVYSIDEYGQVKLVWNIYLDDIVHGNYWELNVDALTGEILYQRDAVYRCALGPFHDHSGHDDGFIIPNDTDDLPPSATQRGVQDGSSYRVYPLGVESPIHGSRVLVTNPADPTASPYGWHDTNGDLNPDFTTTRGNNVWAYDDPFANNTPSVTPSGGASLTFDFGLNFSQSATAQPNKNASITNLFYWNNMMHDVSYANGFTEVAGNFQSNNYGRGGRQGDFVRAEAQDGSGSATAAKNNANFSSPADGSSGRMQMYMWDSRPSSRLDVSVPVTIAGTYTTGSSLFGPCAFDVSGQIVAALSGTSPLACGTVTTNVAGKIALIDRGSCNFTVKVKNAQNAGAIGVIIVDTVPNQIINMSGDDATITIPAVSITRESGLIIKNVLNQGVQARLVGDSPTFCNDVDGSFDNGVVAHEYAHGISNRLTGGPLNAGCLSNREQMGEGWSDFFGLVMTAKPEHTRTTRRGIGNYAVSLPITGAGIRQYPYTTDMTVNPHTYDNIKTMSISAVQTDVHSVGSVWCAMLWEMYWNLVDKHGFSSDLIAGDKGNNIAIRLVTEGMKLQACSPGFIDGRNAILKADTLLYGGANSCLIWEAFAKRGLGRSATQGNSNNITDGAQAFDVPTCTAVLPPDAGFNSSTLETCTGQSVSFTNTSTGDITGRTWKFGDGSTSTDNNPSKTYNTPGNYTVTLVVIGPAGTDSTVKSILVKPTPVVAVAGNNSVCAGQEITLTASGASSYSWNTGQSTAVITVTQASTRTYTVTGTTNGCSASASKEVTLVPLPIVSAGSDQVICLGQSIQLTATGATSYSWSSGQNTAVITVSPTSETTYTVTGTTNGCSAQSQVKVSVNPPPVANAGTDQTICAGSQATLNASGGNTYSWSNGSSSASIVVSPSVTTTYTLTAIVGSCSSTDEVTITVLESPQVNASADVAICQGQSTTLTVSGNATGYSWSTGGSGNSISVTPANTTTYFVTGNNGGVCSRTDSVKVTVNQSPTISLGTDVSICRGSSVQLNANISSNGGEVTWSNSLNGTSISVSPTSTTLFSAVVCSNVCPSLCASDDITVNVTPKPVAGFSFNVSGFTVNFENTTVDGTTYTWNFGDGNNSPSTSPSHTYTNPGTYTVVLTAVNGSCSDQISKEITIASTGIDGAEWVKAFGIYPNPSKGEVTVSLKMEKELKVILTVYSSIGQLLFSKDLGVVKDLNQTFDFSDYPSGNYMMQIQMDDELGAKQMIIIR